VQANGRAAPDDVFHDPPAIAGGRSAIAAIRRPRPRRPV